jgi:hypothetical protein
VVLCRGSSPGVTSLCFPPLEAIGSVAIIAARLEDAVGEGVHWVNSKYGTRTEEEENLLPSDDDDAADD